eukprot:CAMPEP_0195132656 /NCGR_PEP_ID=MMETSP0448-20130528/147312_1 /TAXON_ID=66468 /ORGANISM="Heterocapsa triquestra, Strain CCMP 448" /LENGTH=82 /DNA_ID=CAMNT_0040170681 /DNA_START=63 /DNA_END=308 /DNA_ORIENTATION=+
MPPSYNPEAASQASLDFVTSVNVFTMLLFFVECALKIIARGFFFSSGAPDAAYLQDPLNWLDFIVVITSVLELGIVGSDGKT